MENSITVFMFLPFDSIICISLGFILFLLIILLIMDYAFFFACLVIFGWMPDYTFKFVGCWIFLYCYSYPWAYFLSWYWAIGDSLILSGLALMVCYCWRSAERLFFSATEVLGTQYLWIFSFSKMTHGNSRVWVLDSFLSSFR